MTERLLPSVKLRLIQDTAKLLNIAVDLRLEHDSGSILAQADRTVEDTISMICESSPEIVNWLIARRNGAEPGGRDDRSDPPPASPAFAPRQKHLAGFRLAPKSS